MSQNPSWRHHYIPVFYLKQWTGSDGRLVQYSRPFRDIVARNRVSPKQTGFEDRLNELADLPEPDRQRLETHFYSPVDSSAALVMHALQAGRTEFNQRERLGWSRFLTSLIVRNPENVQAATVRLTELVSQGDTGSEQRYQAARRPNDPATYSEYVQQAALRGELSSSAKQVVASVINNGVLVNQLMNMQWGVLTLPFDAPPLLTSDRPIAMYNQLFNPACEILLPLGPKVLFYAVNDPELARSFGALQADQVASTMNEVVVRRAEKYVYAMSDRHLDYVRTNMGIAKIPPVAATRPSRAERRRHKRLLQSKRI